MPYLGQEPQTGAYKILDAITATANTTFALTYGSAAYFPESARNLIVSLNGTTQAPDTAYSISGSNIVFSETLQATDVIDYILVLGDVYSIGTPSDGTVSSGSLQDNISIKQLTVSNTFTQGVGNYIQNRYVLHGTTTDATETEILTINTNGRVPVSANSTTFYEASIVARRTDSTGEGGAWHLKGVADNHSGNTQNVGDVYEIAVAQDDVNWAVDIRADDTNDAIGVHVTGAASKDVSWTTVLTTIEVHQ